MTPVGFFFVKTVSLLELLRYRVEPTISAGERPQTYALDRAATGTGDALLYFYNLGHIYHIIHS